ncbi:MAG TPA: DUF2442 domain-containing protein [Tepidisphaeraceae bacterium]|nr:DUF2442 domain-containing protein [Tepidisphaeraceae bacterium]
MITGKLDKPATHRKRAPAEAAATRVRFANGHMVLALTDGRQLSIPLDFYPTLLRASPAQRSAWQLIGDGTGVVWDDLDLQLSVQYLLEGAREGIPKPPPLSSLRRRPGKPRRK